MEKSTERKFFSGFTLVESLMAAVILAMAITAVTMPFTAAVQNEQSDARRTLAVGLAQEMLEEILTKPFADPQGGGDLGPESDEAGRADFDNVDDYDGYSESAGNICDADGTVISDPATTGLTRDVSAAYVYVSGQDSSDVPTFIRVTIEIKHNDKPLVTMSRLIYQM